jgi:thymidylate synthase (FAD)
MSDTSIYMPDKVKSYEKEQEYNNDMNTVMDIYKKWKGYEDGKKEEDVAKMFLPLASTTDLVLSGNFQALYEFLQLRNCKRAEREIHELSLELTRLLKGLVPEIFGELDCKGKEFGICPESFGSCGKYPTKKECKVVKVGEGK